MHNKPIERKQNVKIPNPRESHERGGKIADNQVKDKTVEIVDLNPTISVTTLNKNTLIKQSDCQTG